MEGQKVSTDENRRVVQYGAIKSQVERDVNAGIAERAEYTTRAEAQEMDKVAGRFRGKAIDEVVETDREARRARGLARISQVIDYVFYVVYTLLAIRLVLALIAARSGSGFVQFIRAVTDPFYSVFRGIVGSPTLGGFTLVLPIVIAIIVYALLHMGITRLLRLIAHRNTEI
ncbi:MAG: YggT family protein [Desulfobacteraceae bacterium]|nr:MAG: YggT family protein [Desulfobacteraceae bacterium]